MVDRVQINVSDRCNLRCKDCHWYSQPVNEIEKVTSEDVLFFIEKWKPKIVQFSGGEPTLWKDLADTVNEIKIKKVIINSNGTRPYVFKNIKRLINLDLTIHKQAKIELFKETLQIAKRKHFKIQLSTFDYKDNPLNIAINQENQMDIKYFDLLGKTVLCKPNRIYFGSDGRAYQCEKGLRTKDDQYFAGFTLREGEPKINTKCCIVDKICLTALNEQDIKCVE